MVKFIDIDCDVIKKCYTSGQIFLKLVAADTEENLKQNITPQELVAYATAEVAGFEFPENHTAIKDFSENAGMLAALVKSKIVEETKFVVNNGFVKLPLVKVLI